jgi:hypothetical protein
MTVPMNPTGGNLEKVTVESKVIVLHSSFFDNHLVATYGYREDDVTAWSNNDPPDTELNGSAFITPSRFFLPSSPNFTSSTDADSYGAVAHVPDEWLNGFGGVGLSFHYSKSNNSVVGDVRNNLRGENIAPVSGETEERGFTISLANDRISIRVNKYKTLQTGEDAGITGTFNTMFGQYLLSYPPGERQAIIDANDFNQPDIANFNNIDHFKGSEYLIEAHNVVIDSDGEGYTRSNPPGLTFTSDLLSEGLEIEAVANLTSNWRLMFNVSQQEVSATNTAPLLFDLIINTLEPNIAEFGHFPKLSTLDESLGSAVKRFGLSSIKSLAAQDGSPKTNEIREWRWNLVTNYQFDSDSKLAGFNVGGAVRWQDEIGIGRELINDPEFGFIPDLDKIIYGPSETQVDAWIGWERMIGPYFGKDTLLKVQLNVRNLLNEDDLIPIVANPDLTIPVIRIPAERRFDLRATLSF